MTNDVQKTLSHRAYIENGILYLEFINQISAQNVLDNQIEALKLLNEQKIKTIPVVVILKDIDKTGFKIPMGSFGKAIRGFDLVKRASAIWIVGAKGEVKNVVSLMNRVFFSGRMYLVDTVEEAQKNARQFLSDSESILEKEEKE